MAGMICDSCAYAASQVGKPEWGLALLFIVVFVSYAALAFAIFQAAREATKFWEDTNVG